MPKGETNIEIAHDGRPCSLNEILFVPSFYFSSVKVLSRFISQSHDSLDLYVAEMFHHFPLSNKLKP